MPSKVLIILAAAILTIKAASKKVAQQSLLLSELESVPGDNDAAYCNVPSSEQLFEVEFFDISPLPLDTDKRFFTFLRGMLPYTPGLNNAQLRGTLTVDFDSGESTTQGPATFPLATFENEKYGIHTHFTVRSPGYDDDTNIPVPNFGGPLQAGVNEIVTDFQFVPYFMESGNYTYKIEGLVPGDEDSGTEEKYLFCYQMSAWLKGDMR